MLTRENPFAIRLGEDGRFHIFDENNVSIRSYSRARDARRGLSRMEA